MAEGTIFNEIRFELDTRALTDAFDVVWFRIETKEFAKTLSKIMTQIDTAMVRSGSGYLLMLEKGSGGAERLAGIEGLVCKRQSARLLGRCDPADLARALLRALPRVKSRLFSEAALGLERGLHYHVKKIRGGEAVRSLRIDIKSHESRHFLTAAQQTFLRSDLVPPKRRGRFSYRIEDGHIRFQAENGNEGHATYQMGAFGRRFGPNTHIPFYDYRDYRQCKVAILARFVEDFNRTYEGICSIRFVRPDPMASWRRKIKPAVDTLSLIRHYPKTRWNLVKAEHTIDIESIAERLPRVSGREVVLSDAIDPDAFNLLVHYGKEFYEGRADPYETFRKKHPNANLSSITPETTTPKNLDAALEVVSKEAVIKEDIRRKKLSTAWIGKEMVFGFSFFLDPKKLLPVTHLMRIGRDGSLTHAASLPDADGPDGILDETTSLRNLVDRAGTGRPFCLDAGTGEWFVIETLPKFPMPDPDRLRSFHDELERTHALDKERLLQTEKLRIAKEFCDKTSLSPKERSIFMKSVEAKWIEGGKMPAGKWGAAFREYLYAEYGLRYGSHGLKGGSGILGYMEGLWFDRDRNEYYVGKAQPLRSKIEKTPKVRRVVTNADVVPEWFFGLMEVGFVKNKDLTVLPYPFKYLREYIRHWYLSFPHKEWSAESISLSSIVAEMYE